MRREQEQIRNCTFSIKASRSLNACEGKEYTRLNNSNDVYRKEEEEVKKMAIMVTVVMMMNMMMNMTMV